MTDATSSTTTTSSSSGKPIVPTTVHVIDEEDAPLEGVLVFASDAEGNLVDEATSDDAGNAMLDMPDGGSVHVAREVANYYNGQLGEQRSIRSHYLVPEGSEVTIAVPREGYVENTPPENDPMSVTLYGTIKNGDGSFSGAPITEFMLDCGSPSESAFGWVSDEDYRGCPGESTFTVYALGYDENEQLIAAGKVTDLPFEAWGDTDLTIVMTRAVYPAMVVDLVGWNEPGNRVSIGVNGATDRTSWSSSVWGQDAWQLSHTVQAPRDLFEDWTITVTSSSESPYRSFQHVLHPTAATLPSTLSVDAKELATLRIASFDKSEPTRPVLNVALEDGPRGDYVEAYIGWGANYRSTQWLAYAPPRDEIELRLPVLPAALVSWTLQPGEFVDTAWVQHREVDAIGSVFDATKNHDWYDLEWASTVALSE